MNERLYKLHTSSIWSIISGRYVEQTQQRSNIKVIIFLPFLIYYWGLQLENTMVLNLWFFVSRLSWVNVTCNTISRSKGQRSRSLCLIKSRHKVHHDSWTDGCTIFKLNVAVKYHMPRTGTVKRSKVKITKSTYHTPGTCTRVANRQPQEL